MVRRAPISVGALPDVYPGIDVVYYATGRNIEYDLIVNPALISAIELPSTATSN
jgi:hypothetical protein